MRATSGISPLIGCRRPFSPSAERLFHRSKEKSMKKSTPQAVPSDPMGIVITTGVRVPVEPLVRAYVWGPAPDEPSVTEGTRAA